MKISTKNINWKVIIPTTIVGIVILIIVTRKMKTLIRAWKDSQTNKSELQILTLQGVKLTYSRQWYESLARKIYLSTNWTWYSPNCDEQTTMSALAQLENDKDYLELVRQFGLKDGYNMTEFIDGCLNINEKEQVNSIWNSKGITKRL